MAFARELIEGLAPNVVAQTAASKYLVPDKLMGTIDYVTAGTTGTAANLKYDFIQYGISEGEVATRALGSDYTTVNATPDPKSVQLRAIGGKWSQDRMTERGLRNGGDSDIYNEQQLKQKLAVTKVAFANMLVNGDHTEDADQFDGIIKSVDDDQISAEAFDATAITNETAISFDIWVGNKLAMMSVTPTHILCNPRAAAIFRAAATHLNKYQQKVTIADVDYDQYMGMAITPLDKNEKGTDVFPIDEITGNTSVVFIRFDETDGTYVVIPQDGILLDVGMPAVTDGGVIKKGFVEFVGAYVPYNPKAVAVATGLKIKVITEAEG